MDARRSDLPEAGLIAFRVFTAKYGSAIVF
jgi:hypothetical protein